MEIIKFDPKDQQETYDFFIRIYREFNWDESFVYGMANIAETFGGTREIFLVAKENEKIIGCVGLKQLDENTALMKRFYLASDQRGTGLASQMLEKIIDFAKENEYKEVVLDTYKDNFRAQKFYQKNGFEVFSPQPTECWLESKHPEIFQFRKLKLEE